MNDFSLSEIQGVQQKLCFYLKNVQYFATTSPSPYLRPAIGRKRVAPTKRCDCTLFFHLNFDDLFLQRYLGER